MTDWPSVITEFHFLRPAFLLLLPIAILLFILARKQKTANNWISVIDKTLLAHLSVGQATKKTRSVFPWLLASMIIITSIALAGPAYEKKPQHVIKNQDALIIVLDLSLSMYSEDEKPSRLVKAKRKISDILRARQDGLTALIVYSGSANTVTPLTDDTSTIENMLKALEPDIMPKYGSNAKTAFQHSLQLMENAGVNKSRILWLTDEINSSQLQDISGQLSNTPLRIITFGTENGAPIPLKNGFLKDKKNNTVIAKLNYKQMKNISSKAGIDLIHNRIDDSDFRDFINPAFIEATDNDNEQQFDVYIDRGFYLSLTLLPLLLLGFRRGSGLLLILVLIQPDKAFSLDLMDYFKNDNQKAETAFNAGEFEQAAKQFKDKKWQAGSHYKNGDFENALKSYEQFDDPQSLYNQANSLAKMGKLEQAIERYSKALESQSNFSDAEYNKKLVEDLLQQQQDDQENSDESDDSDSSEQQSEKNSDSESQQNQKTDQNSQPEQQEQQNQQNQESSKENDSQTSAEQSEEKQQEQAADQQSQQDSEKESEEQQQLQPSNPEQEEMTAEEKQQQQALQQWLRKIPDQPGEYLKNKFSHQYEQNRRTNNLVDQESEQLW